MRITQTSQFKKDIKRQTKRGKDLQNLKDVMQLLVAGEALPPKNRDRAPAGHRIGWRDCHLEPDWLLTTRFRLTNLCWAEPELTRTFSERNETNKVMEAIPLRFVLHLEH